MTRMHTTKSLLEQWELMCKIEGLYVYQILMRLYSEVLINPTLLRQVAKCLVL